ncbi:Carboxylesterase, type B [Fusarium oxysporum f. sp. vasinfectum]|uniref:Carboxylesterase type B domain-containing protein n=1 Tax=Fusarium oxysporum f. sp. vasinfectum 25433 TaxID=1089449 RepID=X0L065_FUSOX|nr:hypothetical protein FOTG_17284 [Fusarium oxysporum f. sp. vasinfectum 25433]KAK2933511.1 Carboxylesterase, type B [Fusarium oxysporum f. sp. vasinfectum]
MSRLQHSTLGTIEGLVSGNVTQFLGIKYASLDHRFGTPKLYNGQASSGFVNAKSVGPAAIGIPNGCQLEHGLIQHSLPIPDFPPESDTECLNLSITVPRDGAKAGKKLPVFVFLHGGALAFGSGTWPQYDQAKIVRRSVELETPIIGVVINYRTNIFGFLTSDELRKAGFKANNGLRDQKVAFEWVRAHIEGFGGDPNQVTAVGQSAGGVSATTLLQCPEQLFQRMVFLSGSCLLRRPVSLDTHEQFYLEFCKAQGFEGIFGDDRIRAIEDRNSLELLLKTPPSVPSLPALDHDLLKEQISFEKAKHWSDTQQSQLPGLEWCKEIVFGDCEYDASVFVRALTKRGSNVAQQLSNSLNRAIPGKEPAIAALLEDYGISDAVDNGSACQAISHLANDLSFYLPCDVFVQFFPGTKYIYHMNEPNPWDGPFKGKAAHAVDVTFLFKNFDQFLSPWTKAVAQGFGDNIIKFIGGQVPWQASSGDNRVALVYGNDARGGKLRKDEPESVGRRATIFRYEESIGYDALLDAVSNFVAGK